MGSTAWVVIPIEGGELHLGLLVEPTPAARPYLEEIGQLFTVILSRFEGCDRLNHL